MSPILAFLIQHLFLFYTIQELLDDQQQEEFVATLENDAVRQARQNTSLIAAAGTGFAALYAVFAVLQIVYPWEVYHHAIFEGLMEPSSVVVAELGAALTVIVATAAAVLFKPHADAWRKLLTLSITLASLEALFWSTAIFKVLGRPGIDWKIVWMVWRPLGPALWVASMIVVINGLDRLGPQFSALRSAQYQLKRA